MSNGAIAADLSTPTTIEALLLDHPAVIAASLVSEQSADGRSYPVAYVVPHPERLREAREKVAQADKEKRVAQWKRAFDHTYSRAEGQRPTFVGWTSCYTNLPLPEAEMQDWLDRTVERILSLQPRRVLEVGCGVGLLVQAIAPRCASYTGTDLSPVAVDSLQAFIATQPELSHVTLLEREAAELADQPSASVDMVIINSVIQYFPDLRYLENVIGEAARIVAPGGHIFLGDIRDLGTLAVFHSAVQLAKAPPQASARWLKQRISLAIDHERELVIDPRFFLALARSDPRIGSVDVLLKRGRAHNELTRYRYDVILRVGEGRSATAPDEVWQAGDDPVADIKARLFAGRRSPAVVRDVPNRRVAEDLAAMEAVRAADDRQSAQSIRDALPAAPAFGAEPEDIWSLSDDGVCDVRLSWPPHSIDGHFDVALAVPGSSERAFPRLEYEESDGSSRALATDPLEAASKQQLGSELRQFLRDRLPESAVPAAVIAVTALPSNGSAITGRRRP